MSYLYGDSSPSPLTNNFLDFLRGALEFSVHILLSDERLKEDARRIVQVTRESEQTTERLHALASVSKQATEAFARQTQDTHAERCGTAIIARIDDAVRNELAALRAKLDEESAKHSQLAAEERRGGLGALQRLLLRADPPDTSHILEIEATPDHHYTGTLEARAPIGFEWRAELEFPQTHLFGQLVRVERFAPTLEVHAPGVGGWLKKEVKLRPQHIERFFITGLSHAEGGTTIRLHEQPFGVDPKLAAMDLEIESGGAISITWAGDGDKARFDLEGADVQKLREFHKNLIAALGDAAFCRSKVVSATFDGVPFHDFEKQTIAVDRLITMMAPIVAEILRHSLNPNELVLRRLLGNDRREEIFVPRSTLVNTISALPVSLRALFDPLGLDDRRRSVRAPEARPSDNVSHADVMSLPPSAHPPAPEAQHAHDHETDRETSHGEPERHGGEHVSPAPAEAEPAIAAVPAIHHDSHAHEEVTVATHLAAADVPPSAVVKKSVPPPAMDEPPAQSMSPTNSLSPGKSSNPLVPAIKRIVGLAKAGKSDEAFLGYAELFGSDLFAECKPEDQRQALKLMVLAKNPPAPTPAVIEAHRKALGPIRRLVDNFGEPADYEMLGVCQVLVDEKDAASASFAAALAIERERSPNSPLVGSLEKRVASM